MEKEKLELLMVVAHRGQGEEAARVVSQCGGCLCLLSLGEGTAKKNVLEYLGLADTLRDALICTVRKSDVPAIFEALRREFHMDQPGRGVAFTVPVHSIAGEKAYRILGGWEDAQ